MGARRRNYDGVDLLSCVVGYFALLTRLEEFAKRDLKNK